MGIRSTPAAKFEDLPGKLPDNSVPEDTDYDATAHITLDLLNNLTKEHLAENAIWRDHLSFTDTYRTFYSVDTVFDTFQRLSADKNRSSFTLSGTSPRLSKSLSSSWLDIDVVFALEHGDLKGNCAGIVSVVPDSAGKNWKIWMIRTWLENYEGHGHPDRPIEKNPAANDVNGSGHSSTLDAIIVGGGQGGLGLAGRLKALGITYMLFDNRPEVGASWTHRYDSLKWHTIREYGNLPFGRTFLEDDDDLLTSKRIGAGFKTWSETHGINAQCGTNVDSARWDAASIWTVKTSGSFGTQTWQCKNLVLCLGPASKSPVSPDWASANQIEASGFKGTVIHAARYHNPNAFAGKRGVVVGTANTAHDVATDMVDAGMDTTMIQRNPTYIFPGEWLKAFHSHYYNMNKPTDVADRETATLPYKIQRDQAYEMHQMLIKTQPERFDALEKAGFRVDRRADLFNNLFCRYGGHYVDVGSCQRIVDGRLKVKGAMIKGLTEDGLSFHDGSEVKADLIVLCTGFEHDFRKDAAEVVGQDVADCMEEYGGMDKGGELRGFAKLAGHPHLYYHGGETRQSRWFSRFVALQVQKELLGEPLQPYTDGI